MKQKIIFAVLFALLPCLVVAEDSKPTEKLGIGAVMEQLTLEDQHGQKHTLQPGTRHVIISANMELSKGIHTWLQEKSPSYLEDHNAEYVADITEMPDIITWLFAGPKMRKYPFRILLADDENFAPHYPLVEDKVAVFDIDANRVITEISYYDSMDAIAKEKLERPKVKVSNFSDQLKALQQTPK